MARILIGNIKGPQGAKGDKGDKGDTGPQGPAGPQGATGPMPALVNGFTTTEAGIAALDAAAGKTLKDEVTQLNSDLSSHFPTGMITQTNVSDTYRYAFSSGDDGYMYIDNVNLSTDEVTRLQFSKNGALDLLTINDGDLNYIGHFISDADFAIGTARIQTTNGEVATSQVSFGKTFSSIPKVFCNIKTSVPSNKWINAGSISTTDFTIYADVDTTGTITVDWFAVAI